MTKHTTTLNQLDLQRRNRLADAMLNQVPVSLEVEDAAWEYLRRHAHALHDADTQRAVDRLLRARGQVHASRPCPPRDQAAQRADSRVRTLVPSEGARQASGDQRNLAPSTPADPQASPLASPHPAAGP